MDEFCKWTEDEDGQWTTRCDDAFEFNDAGPEENGFKFCPFCGLPLTGAPYTGDVDDSVYVNGGEG